MAVILDRTPAHQSLRGRPLTAGRRGLAIKLRERDQRDAERVRQVPKLVRDQLDAVVDALRVGGPRQLQVVHHHIARAMHFVVVLDAGDEVRQLGQRATIDQHMAATQLTDSIQLSPRRLEGGGVEPRSLLKLDYGQARGDGHEASG